MAFPKRRWTRQRPGAPNNCDGRSQRSPAAPDSAASTLEKPTTHPPPRVVNPIWQRRFGFLLPSKLLPRNWKQREHCSPHLLADLLAHLEPRDHLPPVI